MVTPARGKPTLKVGIIGAGFMGRAHAIAFRIADAVLNLPFRIKLIAIADPVGNRASDLADEMSFEWSTTSWQEIIAHPGIDTVSVATPNDTHYEIAWTAMKNGKHVYCEKPLAVTLNDANKLAALARRTGLRTQVGFNYLCNPVVREMQNIIQSGQIGSIVAFRGVHAESYYSSPDAVGDFRIFGPGGGVLADLGSHILALAEFLLGDIVRVRGELTQIYPERPTVAGGLGRVAVEDIARANVTFASGATGTFEASWVATGRTMQLAVDVVGTEGAVSFTQERLSEFRLFLQSDPKSQRGFRRVEAGPEHPPYGAFCPAPGHQLGFNELKAIEAGDFVQSIAGMGTETFDFSRAARIVNLVESIRSSAIANSSAVEVA
jgi:predicted dehydrogenase